MKLEEAKEILNSIDVIDLRETHDVTEETYNLAIETILQELDNLQKENEELRKGNEVIDRFPLVRTVKRWLMKLGKKQHGKS